MPTILYMASSDEFTVTAPYATVLHDCFSAPPGAVEYTAIWWKDVENLDATSEWPAYREQLVTLRTEAVIAVERIEGHELAVIERARAYVAD